MRWLTKQKQTIENTRLNWDQVKKLWGVDKNISFAKKTNADKWI